MKEQYPYRLILESPLGKILIQGTQQHIQYLKFIDAAMPESEVSAFESTALKPTAQADWAENCGEQLKQYFVGKRSAFDLPIDPQGTDFQKRVWHALVAVKQGQVASYQQIALAIGNEKSVRAVASVNARNPIWLLIPCHRIIGSDHALRGYAGGIERKAQLLLIEGRQLEGHQFDKMSLDAISIKTKVMPCND
jgi:methylated-DNA-[protein]-cysteine S-methyltransferase